MLCSAKFIRSSMMIILGATAWCFETSKKGQDVVKPYPFIKASWVET